MDRASSATSVREPSFEEIFTLSLDLLCIGGLDGYFKRVNPAFEQAFGYSSEELLSRPFLDFVHPDDRARSYEALERLTRGQEVVLLENRNVRADGSIVWLQWSARAVPGEPIFYGAGHDVSDRQRSEDRLRQAKEMVEANRDELRLHAEEQAALRRLATLVARGVSPTEILDAVAMEAARLLGADLALLERYEPDGGATVLASRGEVASHIPAGTRITLGPETVAGRVRDTGRPVHVADYSGVPGHWASVAREGGVRSAVGAPITVEGRLWGVMILASAGDQPAPGATTERLAGFTELVATAISNTEARAEVGRLAEEQAALRRVATLVASEPSPGEVFAAVAEELDGILGVENTVVYRYEAEDTAAVVAIGGASDIGVPVGTRVTLEGDSVAARIRATGRPARLDDFTNATGSIAALARNAGIRSAVGSPITVEGRLWGSMVALSREAEPLPRDTESRIGEFAQLVATAIANTESRAEVDRLVEEQAALRRVATLVARGASPTAIFDAVAAEAARALDADRASLVRYEPDAKAIVLMARRVPDHVETDPVGTRVTIEGENVIAAVSRTGLPARIGSSEELSGSIAERLCAVGARASIAVPIVVEGRLWGAVNANWTGEQPPPDTEERMARFAELVATAIANTESRSQLTESRARVLAAADEARRHVVRDLHDGAQQRLVHTIITLKLAQAALQDGEDSAPLVAEALVQARQANAELRELAHGILPSVLSRGGLRAGVDALVSRVDLPVTVNVSGERFPPEIEASAYFVVAEALTNAVKHSDTKRAEVRAAVDDGVLRVEVRDHGLGGATPDGAGLLGLDDRVSALGGRLRVEGPPGGGTLIAAELPLSV